MIPHNRIERWPFPGNPVLNTMGDTEELRVDGEEMLSVYGALTLAIGLRDGKRVFEFLKRLAADAAKRCGGGDPCIYFHDPMGEFGGVIAKGEDEIVEDDVGEPESDSESGEEKI